MQFSTAKRTPSDLDYHIEKTKNCCKQFSAFIDKTVQNNIKVVVFPLRCKSYFCPKCLEIHKLKLKIRLNAMMRKKAMHTITLTIWTKLMSYEKAIKVFNYNFNKFVQILRRKGYNFNYFRILEFTDKNYPHLHIITDTMIPKPIIVKTWKKLMTSWRIDAQYNQSHSAVINYVLKYYTKNTSFEHNKLYFFHCLRRFTFSKLFNLKRKIREKTEWIGLFFKDKSSLFTHIVTILDLDYFWRDWSNEVTLIDTS